MPIPRRKHPPIVPGGTYGVLIAVSEIVESARYPSQRWWRVRCRECGYEGRVQTGALHAAANPDPARRQGTGCRQCAARTSQAALAKLNDERTPDYYKAQSRLAHESMTAEARSDRARKGGRAVAGKPRARKKK